jgi:tRNA pseudouridine38-40 synthase
VDPSDTKRLKLTVHYDGSAFHGWQYQPDQRTVQGELEATLTRLAASPRTAVGSGRTDAGVHATGQVVSVDMPARWDGRTLQKALNATLPRDIWVEAAEIAPPGFHPRFDAVARSYRYDVGTHPLSRSPFHRRWCWALAEAVDENVLHALAGRLPGTRSFRSFSKSGQPERGYVCTVDRATWSRWELGLRFEITANRYLHHMVRYLVGTMVEIGTGHRPSGAFDALLESDPDTRTSPPAPPEGLFLTLVEYPSGSSTPVQTTTGSDIEA